MKELNTLFYKKPNPKLWSGRAASDQLESQYWHQQIQHIDLNTTNHELYDIALLGYACDEGVKRNLGRVGAVAGPDEIRKQIGKLALHHQKSIADFGTILCLDNDLEFTQENLAIVIEKLLKNKSFPIVLGGGHDIAYGHFKGIWNTVKNSSENKIGIINFDAHFDLRPMEDKANSGTPFFQILTEHLNNVGYFPIGIQQAANTPELFDMAQKLNVNYLMNSECFDANIRTAIDYVEAFIKNYDHLYITIDLDGFSSAYAPGVSAPSPMGFSPFFVQQLLSYLLKTGKVISCDIAELNPEFDQDHVTAKLAARLVDIIANRK